MDVDELMGGWIDGLRGSANRMGGDGGGGSSDRMVLKRDSTKDFAFSADSLVGAVM